MTGKSIEFSLVVDSKRRCKGMYFATGVSKRFIRIQNTTHMSIDLNKYKYTECSIMNPTFNIYLPPSHHVNVEAEVFRISCRVLLQFFIDFRRDVKDNSSLH